MFGFPFFTSLIVVLAGVIVFSVVINKGMAKRQQINNAAALEQSAGSKQTL